MNKNFRLPFWGKSRGGSERSGEDGQDNRFCHISPFSPYCNQYQQCQVIIPIVMFRHYNECPLSSLSLLCQAADFQVQTKHSQHFVTFPCFRPECGEFVLLTSFVSFGIQRILLSNLKSPQSRQTSPTSEDRRGILDPRHPILSIGMCTLTGFRYLSSSLSPLKMEQPT